MSLYKGKSVKFKTPFGVKAEGDVEDFTDQAVIILSPIHGRVIVDHSALINEFSCDGVWHGEIKINGKWEDKTVYENTKDYGVYGYLSPDIDDDAC